eukprot:6195941-Lingulodinium_polyedra.AAC.1
MAIHREQLLGVPKEGRWQNLRPNAHWALPTCPLEEFLDVVVNVHPVVFCYRYLGPRQRNPN